MSAASELAELVDVSRRLGEQWELVQAGGGNTSVKLGGSMYIKASGLRLRDMDTDSGLVAIDLASLRGLLIDEAFATLPARERDLKLAQEMNGITRGAPGRRASIESWVHAVFDRSVVHTHPIWVNAIVCTTSCRTILHHLFSCEEPPPLVVPYVAPGYPLALLLVREVSQYRLEHGCDPNMVFLANHGLITVGESPVQAAELTNRVTKIARAAFGRHCEPESEAHESSIEEMVGKVEELQRLARSNLVRICRDQWVGQACCHPQGRSWFCDPPLFPDQVVYCGPSAVWIDSAQGKGGAEIARYIEKFAMSPRVLVVAGAGVIVAGENEIVLDAAEELLRAHVRVCILGERLGQLNRLTSEDIAYLLGWEAEQFRQQGCTNS